MENKTTDELTNQLKKSNNIDHYLNENKTFLNTGTLADRLNSLITEKKIKKADVARKSNLHRTYVYEIFNGSKTPSRDKIIAISFGMELNLEETQKLLKRSGYRELYSRDSRDSIIIFAINKKMNLIDCNDLLDSFSEDILK